MYYLLTLFNGILVAVMVICNGGLTGSFGLYSATVFIHITGLIGITLYTLLHREKPFALKMPWYLYLGGIIGVATTVFNNVAYGRISVSAILALCLFGQAVTSIGTDQIGFMGMPRHPFQKNKLIGLFLISCGIVLMVTNFEVLAIVMSFFSGTCLVISRTLNARFAEDVSVGISTFFNYFTGLITAVIILLLAGRNEPFMTRPSFSPDIYIYFGGLIGVMAVFISNIVVARISAFYMTLFMFIGQVFAGLLLDWLLSGAFSIRNLTGGLFVAAGLSVNLLLERRVEAKQI